MRSVIRVLTVAALAWLAALPAQAQRFQPDIDLLVKSVLVANNTTATVVKATGGRLYAVEVMNNNTTLAYVKLYNAPTATCGSGTPFARYLIPADTAGGMARPYVIPNGDAYGAGITMCVVTGFADNDTTAPAASQFIVNIHYK